MPFVPDTVEQPQSRFVPDEPAAPARPPRTGFAAVPTAGEAAGRGYTPPAAEPSRPEPGFKEKVIGGVEAALNTVAALFGGGAGAAYGGLEAVGENVGSLLSGQKPKLGVEEQMAKRAQQFTPELPQALQTETGREYTGDVGRALQEHGPSVMGIGPELAVMGKAMRPAARAAGDVGRAAGDAALEAATPQLSASAMKRIGTATEAGIPVSPHQLSGNKFVQMLGETAENIPFAGGGSLRRARREKFSAALAKQMDPATEATVLDDATFKGLQDSAGERIGEISSKYKVPAEDFGDLNALARRDTPDVQGVVRTFADDVKSIAEQNGGSVPGDTLRKLRTEAQSRARAVRSSKPDLANALDDVVHRFDDALSNNIAEGDTAALLEARRQYAISKTLEPLLAKYPNGDFPPSALKSIVTSTKESKRRMARGEGGELGEYARVGQEILKDQVSSGTAERSAVHGALGLGAGAGAALTNPIAAGALYVGSALYNLLGPKIVKRMVEAQRRRETPTPAGPPPEPGLAQGFEPRPPSGAPESPLGDLTPDWETAPGAAPSGAAAEALPAEGLTPALGEAPPSTGVRAALNERAGQQIPAVPGRPDLPDTLVTGSPAESAATEPANAAMMSPGAIEARRQQGMAGVERAAAAERAEPVPVGEATEIKPRNIKPAPEMREPPPEKIPVGEATEIKPETVKPAPEIPEHPEVARVKAAIEKRRAEQAKKQADADALRTAAAEETDPEIKKALMDRAEKIAPPKEKANGTPDKPVGTDAVRQEAGAEGVQEGGAAKPKEGKAPTEEKDLGGLPAIDEGFMDAQTRAAQAKEPPLPERGRRQVRRTLEAGMADGTLDKDGASLALWALDKNSNLARGLRAEVRASEKPGTARGAYDSANKIVKLFKGETDPQTAVHEILHHAERMMPPAVQQGIRRAWERALNVEKEKASPERRRALDALPGAVAGDEASLKVAREALKAGDLDISKDYHLTNPTEYWAVNAARIMHERFTGRGSWRAQARQWLREMSEHVKGLVGVRSDSPILKALGEVLDPVKTTGEEKSPTMIRHGGETKTASTNGEPP